VERPARGRRNDLERIEHALEVFRNTKGRPTFIVLDSHIGYGSPNKQDTAAAMENRSATKSAAWSSAPYGWPEDANSCSRRRIRTLHRRHWRTRRRSPAHWTQLFEAYRAQTQISQLKSN